MSYAAPAPLQYVALVRHAAPMIAVTGIVLNKMAFQSTPATSGRLCRARAARSTSPQGGPVSYAPALENMMGVNMNRDGIQMSILCSTMSLYNWSTSTLRGTGFEK